MTDSSKRIAFVSTRISGTDGVSLEIEKWAAVLERMGHECFYIAGQCDDRPPARSHVIPEAHFTHPVIAEINRCSFGAQIRSRAMSDRIRDMARIIKQGLYQGLEGFRDRHHYRGELPDHPDEHPPRLGIGRDRDGDRHRLHRPPPRLRLGA